MINIINKILIIIYSKFIDLYYDLIPFIFDYSREGKYTILLRILLYNLWKDYKIIILIIKKELFLIY